VKSAIVVVGKAPRPGTTKTRLCPPLTPRDAAALYRGFLIDTVATACSLGWDQVTVVYPKGPRMRAELGSIIPAGVRLHAQPGRGLGPALSGTFDRHLAEGFDRVVLIGSDNPTLRADVVEDARRALDNVDVVLGPTVDGGYYLIGMARPHPEVFERITWSTSLVYGETVERARNAGLSVVSMPTWYDVDTFDDLVRLRAELRAAPPSLAPATRAELAALSI
jgi:rSAM/selenodomain-associated transferase 1